MPIVPDRSWFDPVLNCHMHSGYNAQMAVLDIRSKTPIALDIETPGLDRAFTINCVTAAWEANGKTHSVILDPLRTRGDQDSLLWIRDHASALIFHNAPFDVPALYHHGLIRPSDIDKIVDTLVLARMAWPDPYDTDTGKKDLTSLSVRLLGMADFAGGMEKAFKAAGYRTIQAGYEGMDIDSPIYRQGAMADTIATLRIEPIIRQKCRRLLTDHPFIEHGATTDAMADDVIGVQETVHRVMLRRSAVGLCVDMEYLDKYAEQVSTDRKLSEAELARHNLTGGAGKGAALVEYLHAIVALPAGWPRTPTGKLKATKELLATVEHPLAAAQRTLSETDKVLGYLAKVSRQAAVTGRCHPQVGTLAASSTGRMSYSYPELQQFPKDARPIITGDGKGMTSIDWSQIEPVTMGLMAKDDKFLAPYEAGEDLYEPIMRAAKIDRPLAKVVLLATMYGQGPAGLSKRIKHTEDEAANIRRQMLAAMPASARWMNKVATIAENHGKVPTAGGRILPVDKRGVFKAVNYVVQGSAYDVLAHTICEMERQGMGNEIMLAMHDEVVVSTTVASEVQQIMLTPPPFLVAWAGRTPVLRTDRADMGETWAKV